MPVMSMLIVVTVLVTTTVSVSVDLKATGLIVPVHFDECDVIVQVRF